MASSSWWMRRIEEKAYSRLRQLRARKLWDGLPPVPVDHLLEHVLDLTVTWERVVEEQGEQILACLRPEKREVVLNEHHLPLFSAKPGLERFSKAHEAGHADLFAATAEAEQFKLLGASGYRPLKRGATRGDVTVLDARLKELSADVKREVLFELAERQRQRLAAGEDSGLVRRSVDKYAAIVLMPEELVRNLASERDLTRWPSLYEMTEVLEVTITALIVRLKELGLVHDVCDGAIRLVDPAGSVQRTLL